MPWLLQLLLAVSPALWAPLGVVAAALIGGSVSFLLGRRSTSGDIRRTSPDKLWDVAEDIRLALTAEAEARRAESELLRNRLTAAEARIDGLLAEVRSLRARLGDD